MRKRLSQKIIPAVLITALVLIFGMMTVNAVDNYPIMDGSVIFNLTGSSSNDHTQALYAWYDNSGNLYIGVQGTHALNSIMEIIIGGVPVSSSAVFTYGAGVQITINDNTYPLPHPRVNGNVSDTCWIIYRFDNITLLAGTYTFSITGLGGGHDVKSGTNLTVDSKPNIFITKTAFPTTYSAVNDEIEYTYEITNTGNTTLSGIYIYDDKIGNITPALTTLAPHQSTTATAAYTITQDDIDAGEVTNTAHATDGTTVSNIATATVNATKTPGLSITKTANVNTFDAVGNVIIYTYEITNTGNTTLNNVHVVDNKIASGFNLANSTLAPQQSVTVTASYTVTQADLDAGEVINTAYATDGTANSNEDSVTVSYVPPQPGLSIEKTADVTSYDAVNDVITYTYNITNTGNTVFTSMTVIDDKINGGNPFNVNLPAGGFVPGQSVTATAEYTIDQDDIDAGSVTNIAYAKSGDTESDSDTVTVNANQTPGLSITKTANVESYDAVGDVITYKYVATNTGNVSLNNVLINDDKLGPIGGVTPLSPGNWIAFLVDYTVKQEDIDRGYITNIATAIAIFGHDKLTATAEVTVNAVQTPGLSIVKKASVDTYDTVNQLITYSYTITNTGNITLYNINVVDDNIASGFNPVNATLAPQQNVTVTAPYTITQADIDAGSVTNIAYAKSGDTVSDTDTVTVTAVQRLDLSIVKTADRTEYDKAGQIITYTYTIKNEGNTTLDLVVTDDKLGAVTVGLPTLAPGVTTTGTLTYEVLQTGLDNGVPITNTATATGTHGDKKVTENSNTVTVNPFQDPKMEIVKTADKTTYDKAGQLITYTYTVTNTGNITLTGLTIDDDKLGSITVTQTTLAPGASTTATKTYTIDQTIDLDAARPITNIATAKAQGAGQDVEEDDDFTIKADPKPGLTIVKKANNQDELEYTTVNTLITYKVTLTNTGNQTLYVTSLEDSILVTSPFEESSTINKDIKSMTPVESITPANGKLDVGETWTYTYTYTTTQDDVDNDRVFTNTVTVKVDKITGIKSDSVMVTGNGELKWTLSKIADTEKYDRAGVVIGYTVTIENEGAKTVFDLDIKDSLVDISGIDITGDTDDDGDLDYGETWTLTYTYTTTLSDIYNGWDIENTITVDPGNDDPKSDSVTVEAIPLLELTITKTLDVDGDHDPHQSFLFTITGEGMTINEVIQGAGSKTIRIPAGTYTVTEDTGWSWRYTADAASKAITLTTANGSVSFENTLTIKTRLSDEAYKVNAFNPTTTTTSTALPTPTLALPPDRDVPERRKIKPAGVL